VIEDFLFSTSKPPSNQTVEEQQTDESVDCKVIQVVRDDILPHANCLPDEFVLKIMAILNRGSIHSAPGDTVAELDSTYKLREEFARVCFETLLQYSFVGNYKLRVDVTNEGAMNRLAVASLLHRFQEVLHNYVEDERLSGKCPLPRHRMAEISFVLKAVSTLTASLKKAPPENVDQSIWKQLISLYPHLVDCTTSSNPQVLKSLKSALHEYHDLMQPPNPKLNIHNGV
jgi:7,8-dihydro-6-hydroxymethylpterin-pyrophosphokinase